MSSQKKEDKVRRESSPGKVQRESRPNSALVGVPCEDNKALHGENFLPNQIPTGAQITNSSWELRSVPTTPQHEESSLRGMTI